MLCIVQRAKRCDDSRHFVPRPYLPEIVVRLDPEGEVSLQTPPGGIEVVPMGLRLVLLDFGPILTPSEYVNFVSLGKGLGNMPSDARFGSLSWRARVSDQKDLHRCDTAMTSFVMPLSRLSQCRANDWPTDGRRRSADGEPMARENGAHQSDTDHQGGARKARAVRLPTHARRGRHVLLAPTANVRP
jgi:hypothetical protein